ncbi:MAG: LamG-like jellyroll fold domain-containing protein [Bryobacteraceae bacterium]
MTEKLSRRLLLNKSAASIAGLLFCSAAKGGNAGQLARWDFRDADTLAHDSVTGLRDSICSRACKPPLGRGLSKGAFRLDGYSTWLTRDASRAPILGREFTIEVCTALESYPTSEAAFVSQRNGEIAGYFFGIDQFGFLHLKVSVDGIWRESVSKQPIPRFQWSHLVASLDAAGPILLYRDGVRIASAEGRGGNVRLATTVDLLIGKGNGCAFIGRIFPSGVINGLLDEVVIHDRCLPEAEIQRKHRIVGPASPDLALPIEGDPHRPVYHVLPARAWTNEPHGLIHFGGKYHLFYQKNLNGPYWGQINWGHLTSPDLLQWTTAPPFRPNRGWMPRVAGRVL